MKKKSWKVIAYLAAKYFLEKSGEEKRMEKKSDLGKIIRTVLIVIGAIAVICGIVYAVLRFLQPKEDEYSFLHPSEDDEDEGDEEYRDDPDIAEEFDEEQ